MDLLALIDADRKRETDLRLRLHGFNPDGSATTAPGGGRIHNASQGALERMKARRARRGH